MEDDFTPVQSENKRKNYGIADYISSTGFSLISFLFNLFNLEQRIDEKKTLDDYYLLWIFPKHFSQLPFFYDSWDGCKYFAALKSLSVMSRSISI